MKTVCIECRQYSEWDEKTQQKILDKYRNINVEFDDWYEWEFENWATKLAERGYDIVEEKTNKNGKKYKDYQIAFSGFWSQGDGASFTGTVDIIKWLEYTKNSRYSRILKLLKSGSIQHSASIKRDRWHHYSHWNTTSIYHDWYMNGDHPRIEALIEDIEEELLKDHQELNREIYKELQEDYEEQTSDEAVKDTLEANQYEFDETGKIM